jgi:NAD(P)-dependent dehydrogenase (short-subunit alcohol dehydrogenase family)
MGKSIIIIGMGPGLSLGVAEKFGAEGFTIGMVSRSENKLQEFQRLLQSRGIQSIYEMADVANTDQLLAAVAKLQSKLGSVDVLHYNAVDYRMKPVLEETIDDLTNGFKTSVGNALIVVKALLPALKKSRGAVLLTGGGTATQPNPDMASISLGKAGIRNLGQQLHQVLKPEGIFVGTLTVMGWIQPESKTHSPKILADKFWELYTSRNTFELVH